MANDAELSQYVSETRNAGFGAIWEVEESDRTMALTALSAAAEVFRGHVEAMHEMAAFLRDGGDGGDLWASGEDGAVACDRLAAQFLRQVEHCERIADGIEQADKIVLHYED